MLCISMRAGDYFTVGENTVIQFTRLTGDRAHITVNAPVRSPSCGARCWSATAASGPAA